MDAERNTASATNLLAIQWQMDRYRQNPRRQKHFLMQPEIQET
jgi:hypothetical protein